MAANKWVLEDEGVDVAASGQWDLEDEGVVPEQAEDTMEGSWADTGRGAAIGLQSGIDTTKAGFGTYLQAPRAWARSAVEGVNAASLRAARSIEEYNARNSAELGLPPPRGRGVTQERVDEAARSAQQAEGEAIVRRKQNVDTDYGFATRGLRMESEGRQGVRDAAAASAMYSPEMEAASKYVDEGEGFVDTVGRAVTHPTALVKMGAESMAPTLGGLAAAKVMGIAVKAISTPAMATRAASITGVTAEAGTAALSAREGVFNAVEQVPFKTLAKSSTRFNELVSQLGDEQKARTTLANELASQAPVISAVGTAAGTIVANRLFGGDATAKALMEKGPVNLLETGKRIAQEGVEGGLQAPGDEAANYAGLSQADPNAKFDLGKATALGMLTEAGMGVGGHGYTYAKGLSRAPSTTPAPTPTDLLNPTPAPTGGLTPSGQTEEQMRQAAEQAAWEAQQEKEAAAQAPAAPAPPPTTNGVSDPTAEQTQAFLAQAAEKEKLEEEHKQVRDETINMYGTEPIVSEGKEIGVTFGGKPFYYGEDGTPGPEFDKAINSTIKAEMEARQLNPDPKAHALRESVIESIKEAGMVPAGKVTPASVDGIIKKLNLTSANAPTILKHELKMLNEKKGKGDAVKAGFYKNLLDRLGGSVVTPTQGDQNAIPVGSTESKVSSPAEGGENLAGDSGRVGQAVQGQEAAAASQAEGQARVERRSGTVDQRNPEHDAEWAKTASHDELRAAYGRRLAEVEESRLDPLTGLKNFRAYNEAEKMPVQVWVDVDSLGWFNDYMGEATGDELLKAVAKAMAAETETAYRRGGDELVAQAQTDEEANAFMEAVQKRLDNVTLTATKGGEEITVRGLGVSYATGQTYDEASIKGHDVKKQREAAGKRSAKGTEPPGTTRSRRGDGAGVEDKSIDRAGPAEKVTVEKYRAQIRKLANERLAAKRAAAKAKEPAKAVKPVPESKKAKAPSAAVVTDATGKTKTVQPTAPAATEERGDPGPAKKVVSTETKPVMPTDSASLQAYEDSVHGYLISGVNPQDLLAVSRVRELQQEGLEKETFRAAAVPLGVSHTTVRTRYRRGVSQLKANAEAAGIDWDFAEKLLGIAPQEAAPEMLGEGAFENGQSSVRADEEYDPSYGLERNETAEEAGVTGDEEVNQDDLDAIDAATALLDKQITIEAGRALEAYPIEQVEMAEAAWGPGFHDITELRQAMFVEKLAAVVRAADGNVKVFEAGVAKLLGDYRGDTTDQTTEKVQGSNSTATEKSAGDGQGGLSDEEPARTGSAKAATVTVRKSRKIGPATLNTGFATKWTSRADALSMPKEHYDVFKGLSATLPGWFEQSAGIYRDDRVGHSNAVFFGSSGTIHYGWDSSIKIVTGDRLRSTMAHELTHVVDVKFKISEDPAFSATYGDDGSLVKANGWVAKDALSAFKSGNVPDLKYPLGNLYAPDGMHQLPYSPYVGEPREHRNIRGHRELFAQLVAILHGDKEQADALRNGHPKLVQFIEERINHVTAKLKAGTAIKEPTTASFAYPGAGQGATKAGPGGSGSKANSIATPSTVSPTSPTKSLWEKSGSVMAEFLKDPITNAGAGIKTHVFGWAQVSQLVEAGKKTNSKLSEYKVVSDAMQSMSKSWVVKAADIDAEWGKLDSADADSMHIIMRAATRAGYDPSVKTNPVKAGGVNIQAAYDKLVAKSPRVAKVFTAARDHYSSVRNERKSILVGLLKASQASALERARETGDPAKIAAAQNALTKKIKALDDKYDSVKGPYFPLLRIGGWYTEAKSKVLRTMEAKEDKTEADKKRIAELRKDANHYTTSAYDSKSQATRAVAALEKKYGKGNVSFNMVQEKNFATEVLSNAGMQDVEEYINETFGGVDEELAGKVREMMTELYYDALPEHHALKREMRREGVHGEEKDMRRVFAITSMKSAHYISRLKYADQLKGAMFAIKAEAKEKGFQSTRYYNEIAKRAKLTMDSSAVYPGIERLVTASYLHHLGANPAFILQNATQVAMITAPWLAARTSTVKTSAAIGRAYGQAADIIYSSYKEQGWRAEIKWDGKVSKGAGDMLTALLKRNLLDITIEHDLGATAQLKSHTAGDILKGINLPVHVVELANRTVTALAAYDLATNELKMSQDKAEDFAADAVSTTQIDYSGLNAPRHMQRVFGSAALARVSMQFRKYPQAMLWLVGRSLYQSAWWSDATPKEKREARRTLFGLSVTTSIMAGSIGLPMVGSAMWALSMIASIFGDDDDPWDAEVEYESWLSEMMGEEAAALFMRGLPSFVLGVDLSKRLGMGDIANPLSFAKDAKDTRVAFGNYMTAAGGAPVGTVLDVVDGINMIQDGDWAKGFEKLSPVKGLQNAIRASRFGLEGMTQRNGSVILPPDEFTPWDITLKAAGFATEKEARYYADTGAVKGAATAAADVRKNLLERYTTARVAGEDTDDIQEKIDSFNERHPEQGVRIDFSTKQRSVAARRALEKSRRESGVAIGKREKPFADRGTYSQ